MHPGQLTGKLDKLSMRFLPTKWHATLDYIIAGLMLLSHWIFNLDGIALWIFFICGLSLLLYSAITDYEFSILKKIPTSYHLQFDVFTGAFIVISPVLFNFYSEVFFPQLILGSLILVTSLITHIYPDYIKKAPLVERIYKTYV